ncbi:MAG: ArnT family glycosyltransferase [Thermodesulfobacteriota bacterium]
MPKLLSGGARTALWGGALLLALSLFMGSKDLPLRDFREVRFAELGREMLRGEGDWIVPHLNGSPFLNKPPLLAWLVALSMQAMGENEFAARLPNVLATVGTAACVGWLVSMILGPSWGIMGTTLFLGSPGAQYYGRMLSSDVVSGFFMTAAIAWFCWGITRSNRRAYLVGFALCALAVMCRGLTGLLYPVAALAFFLFLRDRAQLSQVPWFWGLVIISVICVPWFLMVEIRQSGFLIHHFLDQQFRRVLPGGGQPFVALPRWELLLGLLGFLGPLGLLIPWAMALRYGQGTVRGFLWTYVGVVLISVMVSAGRNHPYTIPAIPALVSLAGAWLAQPREAASRWMAGVSLGLLGLACGAGIAVTGEILGRVSEGLEEPGLIIRVQVCMGMISLLLLMAATRLVRGKGWVCAALISAIMLPGGWMLSLVQGAMAGVESRRELATWISRNVPEQCLIVVADPEDRQFEGTAGWNFYSGRRVLMVSFQRPEEIRAQAPELPAWIISREQLNQMLESGKPLVLAATSEATDLLSLSWLPRPSASDRKFKLWVLAPPDKGMEPEAAPLQTGKMSCSSTSVQEG